MNNHKPMKTHLPILPLILSVSILLNPVFLFAANHPITATPDSIPVPWQNIDLTGSKMKPGVLAVVETQKQKNFPILIPIGGLALAGGLTAILIAGNDGTTQPELIARNDNYSFPCNQSTLVVDPLTNDSGESLSVVAVSGSNNVSATVLSDGRIEISDFGALTSITLEVSIR